MQPQIYSQMQPRIYTWMHPQSSSHYYSFHWFSNCDSRKWEIGATEKAQCSSIFALVGKIKQNYQGGTHWNDAYQLHSINTFKGMRLQIWCEIQCKIRCWMSCWIQCQIWYQMKCETWYFNATTCLSVNVSSWIFHA